MNEKAIEGIRIAIHTEIKGHNFYIAAIEMINDEQGKGVFRHLAKEELEHISVLRAIAASLEIGQGWLSYSEAAKVGTGDKEGSAPIFHEVNELTKRLKRNPTELNAVTIAVEVEEKAVAFYSEMLKGVKEPGARTVLIKILDMERGHLKLLRWEYEAIVRTGFWCDFMEFSVEKDLE